MTISCGKRLCRPLPTFPIEMCKTIFDSLSENHMWLLISNYLCIEVNAVMWCPNVVKPCWPNKHLVGNFSWGRVLRSGGRVLRGSGGPSSPWGRVLRGADFSMGPSFGLGRVLRGAEFSGIRYNDVEGWFIKKNTLVVIVAILYLISTQISKHTLYTWLLHNPSV